MLADHSWAMSQDCRVQSMGAHSTPSQSLKPLDLEPQLKVSDDLPLAHPTGNTHKTLLNLISCIRRQGKSFPRPSQHPSLARK